MKTLREVWKTWRQRHSCSCKMPSEKDRVLLGLVPEVSVSPDAIEVFINSNEDAFAELFYQHGCYTYTILEKRCDTVDGQKHYAWCPAPTEGGFFETKEKALEEILFLLEANDTVPPWQEPYQNLDLCGGTITYIFEDDEDMLKITYEDGMLIDVGKPAAEEAYCITVVASDDEAGWKHPLSEITVCDSKDLANTLQEAIENFRQPHIS